MEKLVTIATFQHSPAALEMKLFLEQHDLEVFISDDHLVQMDWLLANAVGGIKLQVRPADAARASELVEEHESKRPSKPTEGPDVEFACDECDRDVSFPGHRRGGVETCPHCGCYLDVPE